MTKRLAIAAFLAFAALIFTALSQNSGEIAVVVNKSVTDSSFSRSKLIDIYTMNKTNWKDGTKVCLIDVKGDNPAKQKFYDALGVPYSQVKKIWIRKQFSGQASPPRTYNTEEEALEQIAQTPGAIGYAPADKVGDELRVIAVIK